MIPTRIKHAWKLLESEIVEHAKNLNIQAITPTNMIVGQGKKSINITYSQGYHPLLKYPQLLIMLEKANIFVTGNELNSIIGSCIYVNQEVILAKR